MSAPAKTWICFLAAVLLVGGALGWISTQLFRFEEEHTRFEAQERFRANLRLAVWRIDSLMAPVLAEEAARPPSHYQSFYPLARSYDSPGFKQKPEPVYVPSPLLNPRNELTTLNFQVSPEGEWTSPQVPPDDFLSNAIESGASPSAVEGQKKRLAELSNKLDPEVLGENLDQAFAAQGEQGADPERWFVWNDPVATQSDMPVIHFLVA